MGNTFTEYNKARRENRGIKVFAVEASEELLRQLDEKLEAEGKTRSRWFRVMVAEYIAGKAEQPEQPEQDDDMNTDEP